MWAQQFGETGKNWLMEASYHRTLPRRTACKECAAENMVTPGLQTRWLGDRPSVLPSQDYLELCETRGKASQVTYEQATVAIAMNMNFDWFIILNGEGWLAHGPIRATNVGLYTKLRSLVGLTTPWPPLIEMECFWKKSFLPSSTLSRIYFSSMDYKTVRSASSYSQPFT